MKMFTTQLKVTKFCYFSLFFIRFVNNGREREREREREGKRKRRKALEKRKNKNKKNKISVLEMIRRKERRCEIGGQKRGCE